MFLPLISAVLPTVIICAVSKMQLFHILTLGDWKLWGIALFTICLTSVIILFGSKRESEGEPAHLLARCVEAAFMEIIIEVFASFAFSIGIGYVFWASGCLVIPMFSHALERYATNKIKIKS